MPVVEKEIKWTKRAGPELAGKVKEVIPQINHTDKWPRKKFKGKFINAYSMLQDRYYEHMAAAGFPDIQRGERGSAAEHLSVEEYKYQQEKKRVAEVSAEVERKEAQLGKLDKQLAVKEKAKATITEVNEMGHTIPFVPGVHFTDDEAKKLKTLVKKSVTIQYRNAEWKKKVTDLEQRIADLKLELKSVADDRDYWKRKFKDLENMVNPYFTAIINFPQALKDFIDRHWQERRQQKTHTQEVSR